MLVIEVREGDLLEEIELGAKDMGITDAAIVTLIGAADSFTLSTMPAADATKDDGLRLNLAAPLYWFAPRTKLTRRAADFLIPATGQSAQARRRAARQRRTTRRGSERA